MNFIIRNSITADKGIDSLNSKNNNRLYFSLEYRLKAYNNFIKTIETIWTPKQSINRITLQNKIKVFIN